MKLSEYLQKHVLGEEMTGLVIMLFFTLIALAGFFGAAFWLAGYLAS